MGKPINDLTPSSTSCKDCPALTVQKSGSWCRLGFGVFYEMDKNGNMKNHRPTHDCDRPSDEREFKEEKEFSGTVWPPYVFEFYKGRGGHPYRWRVIAPNGRIIIPPEGHTRKRNAKRAAWMVLELVDKHICVRDLV